MDHHSFVGNAIKHSIFIYDIGIEDGDFGGELARRSVEMYENNIILQLYNNHFCYVDDINTFFKRFAVLIVILLLSVLIISTVT